MGAAGLSVLVGAHYCLLGERREGLVVRDASRILRRVVELTALSFLLEDPDAVGLHARCLGRVCGVATLRWGAGRLGCLSQTCSWPTSP
jgi:hypothetical protein